MCDQCGIRTSELTLTDYGELCATCAYRQAEHDERADTFGALSARSLGFLSETE